MRAHEPMIRRMHNGKTCVEKCLIFTSNALCGHFMNFLTLLYYCGDIVIETCTSCITSHMSFHPSSRTICCRIFHFHHHYIDSKHVHIAVNNVLYHLM